MSFFRVTEPGVGAVAIPDLGVEIADSAVVVLSDQFSVNDMYLSADLEAAIIGGDLTVEIDYGTGYAAVLAGDYSNRDCISAFLNVYEITNENNNEDLVDGSDASVLHNHDSIYYTQTVLNAVGGGALIGVDDSGWTYIGPASDAQTAFDNIDSLIGSFDLDDVYTNDADGIMNVNGAGKDLDLKSNNTNDILISRTDTTSHQNALLFDVSANELALGSAAVGGLAEIDVHILTDLVVDGNITFTGTITDTTVNNMNVTNANITLRDGAATGADASILVERGSTGNDASLLWDETADRWKAGLDGAENTIALLELDEVVTGVWEFQGGGATEPSMYFTDKAAAATTNLGTATQVPMEMINNKLAVYDKTRTKWLSVYRDNITFHGRDNQNNKNEYARIGDFTSNQAGIKLIEQMTLVGVSIQTRTTGSWVMEVRRNGAVTVIASTTLTAVDNIVESAKDVDFAAGDEIQVYINGTSVDRPLINLVFAQRF